MVSVLKNILTGRPPSRSSVRSATPTCLLSTKNFRSEWDIVLNHHSAQRQWTAAGWNCALKPVAYPGILFGWGGSKNSVEDIGQRERRSGGGSPLVRGSEGSCNLVQEI